MPIKMRTQRKRIRAKISNPRKLSRMIRQPGPPYLGSTPSPARPLRHVFDRAMKIRLEIIDIVDSYAFLCPYGKMIDPGTDVVNLSKPETKSSLLMSRGQAKA